MTLQQLQQEGYIYRNFYVEKTTYQRYLDDFGTRDVCSPNGVSDRLHIRTIDNDGETEYEVWDWVMNGHRGEYIDSFATEEEAELYIYAHREWYASEKNWDAPTFWDTYEEAVIDLAGFVDKPVEVVMRYLRFKEYVKKRNKEMQLQDQQTRAEHVAKIKAESEQEASSITIDDEFIKALDWADQAKGIEKNNRHASALKGLLARNNKEKIASDFWQVFRILKAKAETLSIDI